MAAPTWVLHIDLAGGTSYATNLVPYFEGEGASVDVERGFSPEGSFSASGMTLRLNNRTGDWTRHDTGATLYGSYWADAAIRLRVTVGVTTYTLWTGTVVDYEYDYSAETQWVTLTCESIFARLARKEPKGVTYSTTRKVDDAITAVITDVGGSVGADGSTGDDLPAHYNNGQDALSQCYSLADAELCTFFNFFEQADGTARFLARWAVLGVTADDTWGTGTSVIPIRENLRFFRDDRWSEANVRASMTDTAGGTVNLFSMNNTVTIPAGESYRFYAPFGLNTAPVAYQANGTNGTVSYQTTPASAVTSPVATTDYTSASLTLRLFSAGSNGADVEMYNSTAGSLDLDFFRIRGTFVNTNPESAPILSGSESAPQNANDASVTYSIPWLEADQTTLRWAYAKMSQGRYEWPWLTISVLWGALDGSTATKDAKIAAAEIGDVIYYTMTATAGSQVTETWRIAGIHHTVTIGQMAESTFTLVPSYLWQCVDNLVYDDFNRPDASGSLGKAPTGQTWTGVAGTAFDIVSGKARPNSTGTNGVYVEMNDGDADLWVKLGNMGSDADEQAGILFRYSDSSNYWSAYLSDATDQLRLLKVEAGTPTQVVDYSWTPAADAEIRVIAQDTRIRVFLDGVLRIDTTSSFNKTATKHGFLASSTTTVDHGPVYMAQI